VARGALQRANAKRPGDRQIKVLVNNSDGLGHSWGSHLSVLIQRQAFDNILWRKPLHLQFLASFQVSNLLLSGQGKAGAENARPAAPYQLSQRADFFECLLGIQTTQNRPIVNSRDESLAGRRFLGDSPDPARLHIIFYDSHLADGSCVLTVGSTQMILTMLELGLVNPQLVLDDPLEAVVLYSHDPTFKARAELISKKRVTILELQSAYLEEVKRHAARGVFEGIVPRCEEIIALWEDTLNKFAACDLTALAPRLDWVMKLMAIDRAMELSPSLDWDSPEIKMLDAMYSSLGDDGLFRNYEASGFTERLVPTERVEYFTKNPPQETRAWTRAWLLRRAMNDGVEVESVDWDRMTFKMRGRYAWPTYRTLELANPFGFTRAEAEPIFDSCEEFADLLDGLESLASDAGPKPLAYIPAINQTINQ
jgi:proteasome accessory factor A